MTPDELALYALTAFDLGDLVEIDDSEIIGEIAGFTVVIGDEDKYLVAYHDNCGNPKREWWPASALSSADDDEPGGNVIKFPSARERANLTRH